MPEAAFKPFANVRKTKGLGPLFKRAAPSKLAHWRRIQNATILPERIEAP